MRIQRPAVLWLAPAIMSVLAACGGDPVGDRSRPTVTATSPTNAAAGVERTSVVTATFSEPVVANTVNTTSFTVAPSGGAPIAGTVTMTGATATFTPAASLASGTTYTARLTDAVKDVAGNELTPFSWTFATAVNPPPVLQAMSPPGGATNVARNTTITAAFNENIAPQSVTSSTFTVTTAGGASVAGTLMTNNAILTFTPTTALAPSTTYTVRLTTGITDVEGAPLAANVSWTFTTVANIAPTATAGPTQDVNRGAMVQLMGNATDPEGEIMTFRWTQVAGPDVTNGAGFFTGATVNFTAPNVVTALRFELRVTDQSGATSQPASVQINVMENALRAIFVSPLGNDASNGTTRGTPVRTITTGIARAAAAGSGTDVYVVNGTYIESVTLANDVSIYGGFQSGTWLRDREAYPVTIQGSATEDHAVSGDGASGVTLDGLRIITPIDANGTGGSRFGVLLVNAADIVITNNRITAGDAGPGAAGLAGLRGIHGHGGFNGTNASCTGTPQRGLGGPGGDPGADNGITAPGFTGGAGGDGGTAIVAPTDGRSGEGFSAGAGGPAGSSSSPQGTSGGTGSTGSNGSNGAGGLPFGLLSPVGYMAPGGIAGSRGNPGASGGGGGGGFATTGAGGGGGGGGASGGWGEPGAGGGGGGASIAILVMTSQRVLIQNNVLTTGRGGAGGAGGTGGAGGLGALGGSGGSGCGDGGAGGFGGKGGDGGRGGHGGGGGGGPSIGILEDAASTVTIGTGNTYQLGPAGVGGTGPGEAGANGISAQTRKQ